MLAVTLKRRIDGISCRTFNAGYDYSLLIQHGVDQRTLANVWSADHGKGNHSRIVIYGLSVK